MSKLLAALIASLFASVAMAQASAPVLGHGERIGEIESLSVLPAYRGGGLGSTMLDRLEAHLRARGARDLILGVLPGNDDALRLYERRGYRPTWLYLSQFDGRD